MKKIISEKNQHLFYLRSDMRGDLSFLEYESLPFTPSRMFVVKNVPQGTHRGGHAHYTCKQLIICLGGCIKVYLNDGLSDKDETHMLYENDSLFVPELIWDRYIFKTKGTCALVLSSTKYDRKDYIEDFDAFQRIKREMEGL